MEIKSFFFILKQAWDRLRSRKFTTLAVFFLLLLIYAVYRIAQLPTKHKIQSDSEFNECIESNVAKYRDSIHSMDTIVSKPNDNIFVPYSGNGHVGISLNSKIGIHAYYQKSLSLPLKYDPLPLIFSEDFVENDAAIVQIVQGLAHRIQSFQNDGTCITVKNTLFAHRIRPSLIIHQIAFKNPSRDPLTFQFTQIGASQWNNSTIKIEKFKNHEFTITTGFITVKSDNKDKYLCISIASSKLPKNVQLKPFDYSTNFNIFTVVKYANVFLTAKPDLSMSTMKELESSAKIEFEHSIDLGVMKLKEEHITAWNKIWNTGFSISKSLAANSLNGDQLNSTIYYVLCNNAAPLHEISFEKTNKELENLNNQLSTQIDRCYEGFSTLQAVKLWSQAKNETDISELSSLWYLTLMKNGCQNYLKLGVDGIIQAIILSIGSFKFSNHHLELNLNPKQIHRNYKFRGINYANLTLFNITVEVGDDNHAKIRLLMDDVKSNQEFFACDAGCIDEPVELVSKIWYEFPVKLTNPLTAILFITADKTHASELKHILHVQEVELAPPQDVNSVALHRHGHHFAGLSVIFWTIFVFLIVVFHLFLCKLIFRELVQNNNSDYEPPSKYRYARARAI